MNNEIQITWSIHDVQSRDSTLSDEDAIGILFTIKDNFDAAVGVNWEVIDAAIEVWKSW
tara:strand:- start:492 stop:668 length:177 start_codon:yes stop_codon:yes gene_type:complete